VTQTGPRSSAVLPPLVLAPEEAAVIAVALATGPDGPYPGAGRSALEKVLGVLEPDPQLRAQLLASLSRVGGAGATGRVPGPQGSTGGAAPRSGHPAGRARRPQPGAGPRVEGAPRSPRLVVLPGGRA
jgi:hypothetical protein